MIVVDTNVIVHLHLTTDHSQQACALLERDPDWAAPLLWRSEFCNVLAGFLRKGILSQEQAQQILNEAQRTMHGREFMVSAQRVLDLTAASNCSAYDCEFIALAQDLGVKVVTTNRQILNNFPTVALGLDAFT
ncbi:MAG: type II toxin-antitoxin system VapC family toxin [Anaerolineales bacterium]|nr:type II toxin-antitoxin system VapC family toxin [Anaerolineales bacterium]MCX7608533.1 type II toxin-antitoxin system VapC family toxin [Anaerolineales bacterium]MDW8226774.1 type II toxin-antitoxin system VapC family toxin [Anaerolineales bacterium]